MKIHPITSKYEGGASSVNESESDIMLPVRAVPALPARLVLAFSLLAVDKFNDVDTFMI